MCRSGVRLASKGDRSDWGGDVHTKQISEQNYCSCGDCNHNFHSSWWTLLNNTVTLVCWWRRLLFLCRCSCSKQQRGSINQQSWAVHSSFNGNELTNIHLRMFWPCNWLDALSRWPEVFTCPQFWAPGWTDRLSRLYSCASAAGCSPPPRALISKTTEEEVHQLRQASHPDQK